jgi:hypothetical protein
MVKNKNRLVKRKFLLVDILIRLQKGETFYGMKKSYGWTKERLNYWKNELKKANLINKVDHTRPALYELTEEGKNFTIQYVNQFNDGIRLHNIIFTYHLLKEGNLTPEKTWSFNSTVNKLKKDSNATITWTHNSLNIAIASLIGNNAYELQNRARNISDNIITILKKEYDFQIGEGRISRRPHFAVLNPLIDKISNHIQLSSDIAKIDESEGSGELEYFEPNRVQKFIEMPERLYKLEEHLIRQTEIMDKFSSNLELHLAVLNEIKDAIRRLGK